MNAIPIRDIEDERVGVYRNLTTSNLSRFSGRFIAEGRFVVRRLLQSDFKTESLLVSEHKLNAVRDWLPDDVPAYVLPRPLVEQLVGFEFHQGLMACGLRRPMPRLADVTGGNSGSLLVALSRVIDQENLGQLIRTAAAFGADAVALGPGCADPFSRRVLRVSMGNAFLLPIVESANLLDEIRELQQTAGFQTVAAVLDDRAKPLETMTRPKRLCLLFGNEGDGLDDTWLELADVAATIPVNPTADSLNVAVAAGIFMFHFSHGAEHD